MPVDMVIEASLAVVALRADPEKDDPEKAAAEPIVATRAATESFMITTGNSGEKKYENNC